jgi:hypothetical protein
MTRKVILTLYASTLFLPASALAQSAANDPCDELLRSLSENSNLTREQAEAYRASNDLEACQTALNEINADRPTDRTGAAADTTEPAGGSITVEGGAPSIEVQQAAPQITIEQPQSQVTVQQSQPEMTVHQPAPIISIEIPAPEITFSMPTPQVSVNTPEPQVSVKQAEPEVRVVTPPDNAEAAVQAQGEQPQPIIRYRADEARVTVKQADQPVIRFEQAADTGQQQPPTAEDQAGAQDIAANQDRSATAESDQTPAGDQLQVSTLQGMRVMAPDGQESIGTVTAVIMDARQRAFVIINRGADQVAVMADHTQHRGDMLVLHDVDPLKLPVWDPNSAEEDSVEELTGDQTITIRGSSG